MIRQLAAGMVCAVALFATMGASWSANRYMPSSDDDSMGIDAYRAHVIKTPDWQLPALRAPRELRGIEKDDWKTGPIED